MQVSRETGNGKGGKVGVQLRIATTRGVKLSEEGRGSKKREYLDRKF